MNPNVTWDIIKNNNKDWDWTKVFSSKDIPIEELKARISPGLANGDIWRYLSSNSYITFEFINENRGKPWDVYNLGINKFSREKETFIRNEYRKLFMGYDIDYSEMSLFRELMEKIYHPSNLSKFEDE